MNTSTSAFTAADFDQLSKLAIEAWQSGLDRDWSVPAGTLEWSCFTTADHTVDCVFSYALFLASRREDKYPPFTELHALPEATPADIVNGLLAVSTMLLAVVAEAPPDTRSVISGPPFLAIGTPQDFAARGGLELILHTHDVCTGLGVRFDPPRDLCKRLRESTRGWPIGPEVGPTDDPWSDILERSGRQRLS